MEAWPVLHGVLLASDATAFCRWRNESVLDRGAGGLCFIRTDCAEDLAFIANIWARPALLRDLVSLLGETGQPIALKSVASQIFTAKRL